MSDSLLPKDKVLIRGLEDIPSRLVPVTEVISMPGGADFKIMHEMATLCSNVYVPDHHYDPDWEAKNMRYPLEGWEPMPLNVQNPNPPKWKIKIDGLKYEIWKKKTGDIKQMVALVFRGTEIPMDWYVNARWLTRFVPFTWDHYTQTKLIVPQLVQEIHAKEGTDNIEIIATGHSLGGGLAHLAAYTSPHISKVFAFNSSPVTAFYDIPKAERERNKMGKRVYRVSEMGEALGYARTIMRMLYPLSKANPQIVEVHYNFVKDNPINQHAIKTLAKHLTSVVRNES